MVIANYLSESWISLNVVPYALSKIYTNTKYNNTWVGWIESATKDDMNIYECTGTTNESGILELTLAPKYIISVIVTKPEGCIGLYGTSGKSMWIKVVYHDMSVMQNTPVSVSVLYANR